MKNKIIYIILSVLVISGFILFINGDLFVKRDVAENNENISEQQDKNNEDQLEESLTSTESEQTEQLSASQESQTVLSGNNIVTDNFQITPPPGWESRPPQEGILAIAVNTNEVLNNSGAENIGFRSYFAITKDNLQGQTKEEYINFISNELKKISSSVSIEKIWATKIDGKDASALEISLTQQSVDFKALIFLIWDEEDIWTVSFNTITDKWSEYEDKFFLSGSSFQLK
ncbi:MAG: hypothetical protein PHS16_01705 [Candidatus Colwellbacteria bacterium]|jgi:hypothetical protein|nr:hypothetical protein [Candidatus Colwellbacteria bacterium]MCK9497278.1 hypothetical protein [Candidatus Colwellbacteria bacterium]MDD3752635.1 hypothetical protein [Candidatus Colwellbacteria bacterium]MDD4818710.1 hypothetical protein [Candidatus Colwellbacteria bacterium]